MNRGLTNFSNCLTPVRNVSVVRGANNRQAGWLKAKMIINAMSVKGAVGVDDRRQQEF